MNQPDQINAFAADIHAVIQRHRAEFDLTAAAAIGTLEIAKLQLWKEESDAHNQSEEQP